MVIDWNKTTAQSEAKRFIYTASRIYSGTYGQKFFLVLETIPKDPKIRWHTVHYPKIIKLPVHDWEKFGRGDEFVHFKFEDISVWDQLLRLTETNVDKINSLSRQKEKSWTKVQATFLKELGNIVYEFNKVIDSKLAINITATEIGSIGSYNIENNVIDITIRTDADISVIAELIITALYQMNRSKNDLGHRYEQTDEWIMAESISDFILTKTSLKKVFPNFVPTLGARFAYQHTTFFKKNHRYLKELGFGIGKVLRVENNNIYTADSKRVVGLTQQEKSVLKQLIASGENVATYDDIAQAMWGKDYLEKFSMYAINKVIFQIRHKLKINNVPAANIKTVRGVGYELANVINNSN